MPLKSGGASVWLGKVPSVEALGVSIRSAGEQDVSALGDLCRQLGYEVAEEQIFGALRSGDTHAVLVASADGHVIGWVEVVASNHLTTGPEATICGLVVDEGHRGRGIGESLVAAAESWAKTRGIPLMRVRSRVERDRAHRFYLRLGYDEQKRQAVFRKTLR